VAYARALPNPFVYDDERTIVTNASLTTLSNWRAILWGDISRPLVNLSYAVDYAANGLDPGTFHATNVGLHALTVILLFALVSRLVTDSARRRSTAIEPRVAAGTAALLLAVHPEMTQAVA
jgi:protein O-mannosyl-transferase